MLIIKRFHSSLQKVSKRSWNVISMLIFENYHSICSLGVTLKDFTSVQHLVGYAFPWAVSVLSILSGTRQHSDKGGGWH